MQTVEVDIYTFEAEFPRNYMLFRPKTFLSEVSTLP
jgi:hypothetical protein